MNTTNPFNIAPSGDGEVCKAHIYYQQQDYESLDRLIKEVGIDKLLPKVDHLDVVKYLIEKGADIHAQNDYGVFGGKIVRGGRVALCRSTPCG